MGRSRPKHAPNPADNDDGALDASGDGSGGGTGGSSGGSSGGGGGGGGGGGAGGSGGAVESFESKKRLQVRALWDIVPCSGTLASARNACGERAGGRQHVPT